MKQEKERKVIRKQLNLKETKTQEKKALRPT